ncbi:MAG: class I SAM-dependent DNA methyltransferase [Neoaquamicrobium sediminum]
MNAVEIEEAISALAERPFDRDEFPYAFLEAFGNKEVTLKRLRRGESNKSDLGGVLQKGHIHIATCAPGEVTRTLAALKASPATTRAKARFVLATDGDLFEAEDLTTDDAPVSCAYADFPNHFGFFLPLAGITTVKQVRESSFDIRATSRLNRLYLELLKDNPLWGMAERRHDMNHFMARLIFCFFAEDTEIFDGIGAFTATIETMSAKDSSNTHEVISMLFRAMNTKIEARADAGIPRWADRFPYVNGGLFSGSADVPRFSRIARSYLLHIGGLDWKRINPDIFGSMIQAVADDDERGALGMHYTSVPNILKLLNPLFLDDLRQKLEEAGDNARMLLNLRKRMSRIRVFDPACGSGNFLVIAYKEMRAIEAEINRRRGEADRRTEIPLTNFRGIELRDFPAEIARLALIIAEYQCDVLYRGQKEALRDFLPLDAQNWITCGNALHVDWLAICPPTGTVTRHHADDLFQTPLDQAQIDFENEGGEIYVCGNPPYKGSQGQSSDQKLDMRSVFEGRTKNWGAMDYVAAWFLKATEFGLNTKAVIAFVSTNSICQGRQVAALWPLILDSGYEIFFAYTSFKWSNLASQNAGVTVVVIGLSRAAPRMRKLFVSDQGGVSMREVNNINPYLVPGANVIVTARPAPLSDIENMNFGSMPNDGGYLLSSAAEAREAVVKFGVPKDFFRTFLGSQELTKGIERRCIWIRENDVARAYSIEWLRYRFEKVRSTREYSTRNTTKSLAAAPHYFGEVRQNGDENLILTPKTSSGGREYLPVFLFFPGVIASTEAFFLENSALWNLSIISSRIHLSWISTVCGKFKTDFRYSNTLGWNTFPIPLLTEKNKSDLTNCAEEILLARETHFPKTIAELYDPKKMPANLRAAHERNDEVLERIYIGRRFRNDTERLEKLFELYTRTIASEGARKPSRARGGRKTGR